MQFLQSKLTSIGETHPRISSKCPNASFSFSFSGASQDNSWDEREEGDVFADVPAVAKELLARFQKGIDRASERLFDFSALSKDKLDLVEDDAVDGDGSDGSEVSFSDSESDSEIDLDLDKARNIVERFREAASEAPIDIAGGKPSAEPEPEARPPPPPIVEPPVVPPEPRLVVAVHPGGIVPALGPIGGAVGGRVQRKTEWGGFAIAPVMAKGVQTGWGATCGCHTNVADDAVCKRAISYRPRGHGIAFTDDDCVRQLKRWLLAGRSIDSTDPFGRKKHMDVPIRTVGPQREPEDLHLPP